MTFLSKSRALPAVLVLALLVSMLGGCSKAKADPDIDIDIDITNPLAPTPTPAISEIAITTNKLVDLSKCEATIIFGVKVFPESASQTVEDWELITLSGSHIEWTESSTTATLKTKGGKFYVKAIKNGKSGTSETIEVTGCGVIGTPPSQPEPNVDLKANGSDGPITVAKGSLVDVDRFLKNCVSAIWISGPLTGMVGGDGRDRVAINVDTRFGMRCTAASGETDEDFVQVNVSATTPTPNPTPAAPTCPITATPQNIPQGGSTRLSWTSANATSVKGDWTTDSLALSGFQDVMLMSTRTFALTCTGPGGSGSSSVTVTVSAPACPSSIDYSPKGGSVNVGGSRALVVENWPAGVACKPFWHVSDSSRLRVRGTETCPIDGKTYYCGPTATIEGVFPSSTPVRATVQIAIPAPQPERWYNWTVVGNTLTSMLGLDLSFMKASPVDEKGVCQTLACK